MNKKPTCALCEQEAITTAVHVPVCREHHYEYVREAEQYLPDNARPFLKRLLAAEKKETLG